MPINVVQSSLGAGLQSASDTLRGMQELAQRQAEFDLRVQRAEALAERESRLGEQQDLEIEGYRASQQVGGAMLEGQFAQATAEDSPLSPEVQETLRQATGALRHLDPQDQFRYGLMLADKLGAAEFSNSIADNIRTGAYGEDEKVIDEMEQLAKAVKAGAVPLGEAIEKEYEIRAGAAEDETEMLLRQSAIQTIEEEYANMAPHLSEKQRQAFLALGPRLRRNLIDPDEIDEEIGSILRLRSSGGDPQGATRGAAIELMTDSSKLTALGFTDEMLAGKTPEERIQLGMRRLRGEAEPAPAEQPEAPSVPRGTYGQGPRHSHSPGGQFYGGKGPQRVGGPPTVAPFSELPKAQKKATEESLVQFLVDERPTEEQLTAFAAQSGLDIDSLPPEVRARIVARVQALAAKEPEKTLATRGGARAAGIN